MTGDLKGAYYYGATYQGKFTQNIANPALDTDEGIGWDIVEPLNWAGYGIVFFYKRMTGQAMFMYYRPATQRLEPRLTKAYRPIWDDVEAGDFSGTNSYDELVFHNQDSGETLVWDWYSGQTVATYYNDIAHTGILAAGEFGGGPRDDFMLYQSVVKDRNGGEDQFVTTTGRAIRNVDSGASRVVSTSNGWSSRWTYVLATKLNNGSLLYRNPKQIKVHFLFAGMSQSNAMAEYGHQKLQDWMVALERTYAAAGLDFELSGYFVSADDSVVDYVCLKDGAFEPANSHIQHLRTQGLVPDDAIIVLVNNNSGANCSSARALFVKMHRPSFSRLGKRQWYYNGDVVNYGGDSKKMLAHEIGRFLTIGHTFFSKKGVDTIAEFENQFLQGTPSNHASIHNLDADRLSNSAYDTMPALGAVFGDLEKFPFFWRCDDFDTVTLTADNGADGKSSVYLRATPHDVMSYINCDEVSALSYDQIRRVREHLFLGGTYNSSNYEWEGGRKYLIQ